MFDEGAAAHGPTANHIVDKGFDEARQKYEERVDHRLEKDGLCQWSVIEASQERHLICDQHHLADYQRRHRCNEEAGELDQIVGEDQPLGKQDEVETDEKEDGRRQHLSKLMQQDAPHSRQAPGLPGIDHVRRHWNPPGRLAMVSLAEFASQFGIIRALVWGENTRPRAITKGYVDDPTRWLARQSGHAVLGC